MAKIKSVMDKIEEAGKIVNPNYDIPLSSVIEICENSAGSAEMIFNGFYLGYIQGVKAERARQKREGVK